MEIKKKLRKKIICVETGDLDNMLEVSYDIELLASWLYPYLHSIIHKITLGVKLIN